MPGGQFSHDAPYRGGDCEIHAPDQWIRKRPFDQLRGVGGITQHVDDSTIRAGFLEHDSDQLVGRGTKLGTLEHDRVSAGKRHRHCSNGQDHRGIPGSDAQDNTRAPPQALRHTSNCNIDNGK
jgi:hypothetical protein